MAFFTTVPEKLWPRGRIPCRIDQDLRGNANIGRAIKRWADSTILKFPRARSSERNFIFFVEGSQPDAGSVGMTGGVQVIFLQIRSPIRTIMHEIGHAVGFFHEHQRPDRDDHIQVINENIVRGAKSQFVKLSAKNKSASPVYDFKSIMHYQETAFGIKDDGVSRRTIIPREPIRNGGRLTRIDMSAVSLMYPGIRFQAESMNRKKSV